MIRVILGEFEEVAHKSSKKTHRKRRPFPPPLPLPSFSRGNEFGKAPASVEVGLGRKEREEKGQDVLRQEEAETVS